MSSTRILPRRTLLGGPSVIGHADQPLGEVARVRGQHEQRAAPPGRARRGATAPITPLNHRAGRPGGDRPAPWSGPSPSRRAYDALHDPAPGDRLQCPPRSGPSALRRLPAPGGRSRSPLHRVRHGRVDRGVRRAWCRRRGRPRGRRRLRLGNRPAVGDSGGARRRRVLSPRRLLRCVRRGAGAGGRGEGPSLALEAGAVSLPRRGDSTRGRAPSASRPSPLSRTSP